jgi:hypothetical protein
LWEFTLAIKFAVFFGISKYLTRRALYTCVKPYIKDSGDKDLLEARTWKAGKKLWCTVFYTFSVYYGYVTLKDTPWLPWFLGGSGGFEGFN